MNVKMNMVEVDGWIGTANYEGVFLSFDVITYVWRINRNQSFVVVNLLHTIL